ncbi:MULTISPECIES: pyridoxal phosphate-dependent aminotransferase [Clostridium]|jgi:threonine-phosphate decarboxylase|uniref:Histidinol-phosphate transaminase n=1 Tax=Clostridium lapidicellarium TaxID=3240931 RepID=A0ABV4DYE7_9CLOT
MEHGGDVYTEGILKGRELLDFSSNINPLGVPSSFKKNVDEALKNVERYPDVEYRKVKYIIRKYLDFSENYFGNNKCNGELSLDDSDIVLGNGASEIIDLVISCFNSVCIVVPSFIEYEKDALKWGCSVSYSSLTDNMDYDYEDIKLKIKNADALILGNPNNPNGGIIDKDKFYEIVNFCNKNHKTIIIDEAFVEFTGKIGCSFLREMKQFRCIFIVRALTKFFALPGIRFGYGVCKDVKLMDKIRTKQNPWNINCFAETAAEYVLQDECYMDNSLKWIEMERKFMLESLKAIPVVEKTYDTYSNFVLCKLGDMSCEKLYRKCLNAGILIRKCSNFRKLDDRFIRLAIKDRSRNQRLLSVLGNI